MYKIIAPLLLVFLFSSCKESIKIKKKISKNEKIEVINSSETKKEISKSQPQKSNNRNVFSKFQIDKKSQFFVIDPNRDTLLLCTESTSLKIKAHSFRDKISKKEIITPIKLSIQEYYKLYDIVLANLTTTSGNDLLETGGMIYLTAISNDIECELKEESPIEIGFPFKKKKEGMQLFTGDRSIDNLIDWKLEKGLNFKDSIYAEYDIDPVFPGGMSALMSFISSTVIYPVLELENEIQGKVFVQFVILSNGRVDSVKIVKGVSPSLNQSAIDAIKKMPDWIPAQSKGKNVSSYYRIPIHFKFDGGVEMNEGIIPTGSSIKIISDQNITTSTEYEINRYFLNTTKLGWINCDRFIREQGQKMNLTCSLTGNLMMIFHDSKSILPSYLIDGRHQFLNIPINKKVTIIALKRINEQLYLALKTTYISEEMEIDSLEFEPTSLENLKKEMQKLEAIQEVI